MLSKKQTLLHLSLIMTAALAAYANILGNAFVYDDHQQILDNPWLRDPRYLVDIFTQEVWGFSGSSTSDYYRPLMHTLNLLIYSQFGPNRIAFHASSLLLHLGCCVLFYLVCRKFVVDDSPLAVGNDNRLPLLAAALFAVYPANTEAVAWLGSSADLLYVFFSLAAWLCWLRSEPGEDQRQRRPNYSSLVLFFAATLSKETAFLFPVLLVVGDVALGRLVPENFSRRLRGGYLPFVAVGAMSLALRFGVLSAVRPVTHNVSVDIVILVRSFAWYLRQLLWPFRHNFYPDFSTLAGAGALSGIVLPALVLATVATLTVVFRRVRLLWIAFALVVLPLLPALANTALGMPVAERYLYLPGMGFCLFIAWLVCRYVRRKRLHNAVLGLLLVSFAGTSFSRNTQFQNDLTLWGDTIQKSPQSAKAWSWYATALLARGRTSEGIESTYKAIELGFANANSLYDLAIALDSIGRANETALFFNRVLDLHPQDPEASLQVGVAYLLLGDYTAAIITLEQSLELGQDNPLTLIALGRAFAARGEALRALELFNRAIKLDERAYPWLKAEMSRLSVLIPEK